MRVQYHESFPVEFSQLTARKNTIEVLSLRVVGFEEFVGMKSRAPNNCGNIQGVLVKPNLGRASTQVMDLYIYLKSESIHECNAM